MMYVLKYMCALFINTCNILHVHSSSDFSTTKYCLANITCLACCIGYY